MRVLIIPEDPTLDRHVLKPVVERVFRDLGRKARVEVLTDPHLSGVEQALDPEVISEVIEDHPMVDLFILAVDRDCDRFGNTRRAGARVKEHDGRLLAVLAREELEVWPLALHRKELDAAWGEIRKECDPKEAYWDPFVKRMGWLGTVGRGRKRAMRELGRNWRGFLDVCDEVRELEEAIEGWMQDRTS